MIKKIIIFLFFTFLFSIKEHVDGVVAWVESNPILKSEVLQSIQIDAMQRGLDLSIYPYFIEDNFDDYLDLLIGQYVMFEKAKLDTLVELTGDEISLAVDEEIEMMLQRAGSASNLEDILGMPIKLYKMEVWEEAEKRLLIEKYQQKFIFNIDITRPEVISFYNQYSDSLSLLPERYTFSIVEIPINTSNNAEKKSISFLNSLRDSILEGALFETIAEKYSEDPGSKYIGGNLGYIKRGTLVNNFEKIAFSLELNEISKPVKTEFGIHLIQVLDKQGEKLHIRHILQKIKPLEEDIVFIEKKIENIYNKYKNNYLKFDSLAYYYKSNEQNLSNVFDSVSELEIDPFIFSILNENNEKIGLLPPKIKENSSYIIIFVKEIKKSEKATLKNAWTLIETMAKNQKISIEFDLWINSEKEGVFISKLN